MQVLATELSSPIALIQHIEPRKSIPLRLGVMAPTKHEQEIAQLRHERDAERKAHDQTRHQLALANSQLQTKTEGERVAHADLVAARIRIEDLETFENRDKGKLVHEVAKLRAENEELKEKNEQLGQEAAEEARVLKAEKHELEARVQKLITQKFDLEDSRDELFLELDSATQRLENLAHRSTPDAERSKEVDSDAETYSKEINSDTNFQASEELYMDSNSYCVLGVDGVENLIRNLKRFKYKLDRPSQYSDLKTRDYQISYLIQLYDVILPEHNAIVQDWTRKYKKAVYSREGVQKLDTHPGGKNLSGVCSEAYEYLIELRNYKINWRAKAMGWEKRWKQRKQQHIQALKELETCHSVNNEMKEKYQKLYNSARSLITIGESHTTALRSLAEDLFEPPPQTKPLQSQKRDKRGREKDMDSARCMGASFRTTLISHPEYKW